MLNLNKYVFKSDNHQPLHTSGFAYVANGDHIGSSDMTSFQRRQQIEQNRRVIKSYTNSQLGRQYNTSINKSDIPTIKTSVPARPQKRLDIPARHVFSEPKIGGYDPYHVK